MKTEELKKAPDTWHEAPREEGKIRIRMSAEKGAKKKI
jgi:hypothetical protein